MVNLGEKGRNKEKNMDFVRCWWSEAKNGNWILKQISMGTKWHYLLIVYFAKRFILNDDCKEGHKNI